jgi:hypothetical protein
MTENPSESDDILKDQNEENHDDSDADKEDRLFEANMDSLKRCIPALHQMFIDYKPVSQLVKAENGEPDVKFQGVNMYPDGAITQAKRQTDQLIGNSFRFQMGLPDTSGLDLHSAQAVDNLTKRFDESGFQFSKTPIRESAYFLIVFGVGLGQHLSELVERTQCRALILVEPNIDLVYHSMRLFDWEQLFTRFRNTGSIELFMDSDPKVLTSSIQTVFRRNNPTGLDGTLAFRHYGSSIFQEVERGLPDILRTAIMGLGFYQDEINMIAQSYQNLEKGENRVIRKLEENPQIPAFIVGSGPSVEALLPFIEKNQDNAVIISCGTSIDVLMDYGIKPDFWAIAERDHDILLQAQESNELYGTEDIHFVGSTTIFPGVHELFKGAIFFFRPGLSCSPLFAQSEDQIASIPDPLAANAGLSVGVHLGFREFYFFGVDTGSKHQSHGHAKTSWYYRHDAENIKNLSIPLPGNFGGTVWTTPELEWSKQNIEKLIATSPGRTFFNLGDGALIKGAAPKHPKAVRLQPPTVSKQQTINNLIESCPEFSKNIFEDKWEKAAVIDRLHDFCSDLKKAVQTENDPNNFDFIQTTVKLLEPYKTESAVYMLVRGTLFTAIICNEYYANRITGPEERDALYAIFRDEYCALIDRLHERAVEIFKELENGMTWEQFIE